MDSETAMVVRGFLALSLAQRNEFVRVANDVLNNRTTERKATLESEHIIRVNTGPVARTCGCCGR